MAESPVPPRVRLIAFDLDGTLLRGDTVHHVGTRLSSDGQITTHFWPADKARWVAKLARQLELGLEAVAAIGDSAGDVEMLRTVGLPCFVGRTLPTGLERALHLPDGDIREVAERIVGGQLY